ncbi:MAG: ferritin family protein [Candidatus Bathyarchaeota archaeon]|nr:ferritin family protein [Candidatus Bathyarchaeota archaeon]
MSIDGWTVEKALRVGVTMETGAYNLYTGTAKKVKNPGSKKLLQELAADEAKHREYFETALKDPKKVLSEGRIGDLKRVMDLRISDPLKDAPLSPDASYQDTLIFAAKSEQTAVDFYTALSKAYSAHPLGTMWGDFAKMEQGHKLKIEKEYDDVVLADN